MSFFAMVKPEARNYAERDRISFVTLLAAIYFVRFLEAEVEQYRQLRTPGSKSGKCCSQNRTEECTLSANSILNSFCVLFTQCGDSLSNMWAFTIPTSKKK